MSVGSELSDISPQTLAIIGGVVVLAFAVYLILKGGNTSASQGTTSSAQTQGSGSYNTPTQTLNTPINTVTTPSNTSPYGPSTYLGASPSGSQYSYNVNYTSPTYYSQTITGSYNTSNVTKSSTFSPYTNTNTVTTNNNQVANNQKYMSEASGAFSTAQAPYTSQGSAGLINTGGGGTSVIPLIP